MPKLYKKHYLNEAAWEAAKDVYDQLHEQVIVDYNALGEAIKAYVDKLEE